MKPRYINMSHGCVSSLVAIIAQSGDDPVIATVSSPIAGVAALSWASFWPNGIYSLGKFEAQNDDADKFVANPF